VKAPTMEPDEIETWVEPIKAEMKSFTLEQLEQLEQQGAQILYRVMSETTGRAFRRAIAASKASKA